MTTPQESVYNGIPQDLRSGLELLHRDLGPVFYSRSDEEFQKYVELGILRRMPGSAPNSPAEYRFVASALEDLNGARPKPAKELPWEENPYTFDPARTRGQMIKLAPYMEDFVRHFAGKTITHSEFLEFIEGFRIGSPSNLLYELYKTGILSRLKKTNSKSNQYRLTKGVLDKFGD